MSAPQKPAQRHALIADENRLQVCVCGVTLRTAGEWTCWTCGTCHRLYRREEGER